MYGNKLVLQGSKSICLNGWWDFLPAAETAGGSGGPPAEGWLPGAFLVPSTWTIPADGTRRPGEKHYTATRKPEDPEWNENLDCLFDIFDYPKAWSRVKSGWLRRQFKLGAVPADERLFLYFAGVCPRGTLFVNGRELGSHVHPCLPWVVDITSAALRGVNELAVLVEDYRRDSRGRALVPTGNWIPETVRGVWQDVFLVRRPAVHIEDVAITTSVRQGRISCRWTVRNCTGAEVAASVSAAVVKWRGKKTLLRLPAATADLPPGATATLESSAAWSDPPLWFPESPCLCVLNSRLETNTGRSDEYPERFGFREVWIDGPDIMLNGRPLRMFSDWGHKLTLAHHHEGWIRQWFRMIRDANMNHTRLHTHPHPTIVLDIADEEGMLITGEAGMHGSGGAQGADSPEYWEAAAEHVRKFVKRDKNRPSIVMWSVENEMRWNRDETDLAKRELPKNRALFNELDPTRPAYHEGDSSLWDERGQAVVSRHYGKECSGHGWWDRSRPLHSGEMSLYHYSGPNNTCHLGGDKVWASFRKLDEAAAEDTRMIVEDGRVLGVSCFGPWNLCCLDNFRVNPEEIVFKHEDFSKPGLKPLKLPAFSSEFDFWSGKASRRGYLPNASFAIQKDAFRPFALIDTSRRREHYADTDVERVVHCVNDTPKVVKGVLEAVLELRGKRVFSTKAKLALEPGGIAAAPIRIPGERLNPGDHQLTLTFTAKGKTLDRRVLEISAYAAAPPPACAAAVFGSGGMEGILGELGCEATRVESLEGLDPNKHPILLVEPFAVEPGSRQNRQIQEFCRAGGRVVLLEQRHCLFPGLKLVDMPVQKAFIRVRGGHPALAGLKNHRLAFWSDAPYSACDGDSFVARRCYVRPDDGSALPVLDCGEGNFGNGGLKHSPLLEIPVGDGVVYACQLIVAERLAAIPAARQALANLLRAARLWNPSRQSAIAASGATAVELAEAGETVLAEPKTLEELRHLAALAGLEIKAEIRGDIYQALRSGRHPLLSGINNEDTSGIVSWTYGPPPEGNRTVASLCFAPAAGIAPILETATASCLRELFVMNGKTEPLRTHTLTRFLGAEAPKPGVLMGEIPLGKGRIILNLVSTPDTPRFRNRLLANLGLLKSRDPLEGEAVPCEFQSQGHPETVGVLHGELDSETRSRLVSATAFSHERMVNTPIYNLGEWRKETSAESSWAANGAPLVCVYFVISAAVARKNLDMDIGVPNPEALTFLDLQGQGQVEVFVNGLELGTVELADGRGTASDIALECGNNHVLLLWRPANDGKLTLRWRDIMRRPEVDFVFRA